MAEDLTVADVDSYTRGRLPASDPETQRLLDAALARVRRFCGWHVSPVREDTVTVRPGGHDWTEWIILPTLKVVSLTSITEDDQTIDPASIQQFTNEPGVLYKKRGCSFPFNPRYWHPHYSVTVTFQHGFTADEAPDFRSEVLRLVDSTSLDVGMGDHGPLTEYRVDDVELHYSGVTDRLAGIAKNPLSESVLYQYRLLPTG